MARRGNFLDSDDNFREQNLRFVRNDLEDNINQYFGGGSGGRPNVGAPPRDFHVVQPNPVQSEFENRKEFLLQLGLSRSEAVSLTERSFGLEHFSLNYFKDKRHLLRKSRLRQSEADAKIVAEISDEISTIERGQASLSRGGGRPPHHFGGGRGNSGFISGGNGNGGGGGIGVEHRAPSPPRNMDWNERKRGYPIDNDNDGPPVFRNERNYGGLNEFEERRLQFEMNKGRDGFDNFGRRSPQPLQFNDNRNPPNQSNFNQFGGGRGAGGGGGFNNNDDNQFFTRRDNEFTQRNDEFNHDIGFGRPDINDDFNRGGNNFNSNALNADFGRGVIGGQNANQMIPMNHLGTNNMNQNLSNTRSNFGTGRSGNGNGNSLNAANVALGGDFSRGSHFNANSREDFGIGPGGNNHNIGGGNYRDGNGNNNNNFNANSLNLRGDYQGSGPGNNMGGDFRGGNNLNKNMRGNLDIGMGPGGDYRSGNNVNLKAPNTRGDFGGSGGGTVRSGGGNNMNVIANRGGGVANAILPNPSNVRGDFGNNRGAITSNAPNPRATGRPGGGMGGNNSNLPVNSGNNRNVGGGGKNSNLSVNSGHNRNVGGGGKNSTLPVNSGNNRNVGSGVNTIKPNAPKPASGPIGGRGGAGMSAPPTKRQEPANNGRNVVNSNMPKNNDNSVRAMSGPNTNQTTKVTQPAIKAQNTSKKNLTVVRSGGNVGNKPNVQDKPVRNPQRDNKLSTNNSRNPSQNIGNNLIKPYNNNANFAGGNNGGGSGFWDSGSNFNMHQGFSGNFGNNQGFHGNFGGNNQGFGDNFDNSQGFDGSNFNGNGGGDFGNQMGPGGYNFVGLLKSLAVAQNMSTFSNNMNLSALRNFGDPRASNFNNSLPMRDRSSKVNLNLTSLIQKQHKDWPLSQGALTLAQKKCNPPQQLNKSYAVIFYSKRLPVYKPNPAAKKLAENRGIDWSTFSDNESDHGGDGDDDAADKDEGGTGFSIVLPKSLKMRKRKWRVTASSKTPAESWLEFWKQFKPYESKIKNKLAEYDGQNINSLIAFNLPRKGKKTDAVIRNKVKWILQLNACGGDAFRVAKYMYLLKDVNFWSMLTDMQMARILIALQQIKNADWVEMRRSLVLTWAFYEEIISCFDGGDDPVQPAKKRAKKKVRKAQNTFKRGIFHWMVKEAFNELKRISAKEWPAFGEIYPTL